MRKILFGLLFLATAARADMIGGTVAPGGAGGGVSSVSASAPLNSSGGATPTISITGIIGSASLPTNVAYLTSTNTWTATQTFSNAITISSVIFAGGQGTA